MLPVPTLWQKERSIRALNGADIAYLSVTLAVRARAFLEAGKTVYAVAVQLKAQVRLEAAFLQQLQHLAGTPHHAR